MLDAGCCRACFPAVLLTAMLVGCTEETPDWTRIGSAQEYPAHQTNGGITVAAKSWSSPRDRKGLFRSDPGDAILAVQLVLWNNSDQCVRFSRTQVSVESPDGPHVRALPGSDVADRIQQNDSGAMLCHILTLGYGAGIAQGISSAVAEENRKRRKAIQTCSMDLAVVDPDQAMTGFVFFQCPRTGEGWRESLGNVVLRIANLPLSSGKGIEFSLTVPVKSE